MPPKHAINLGQIVNTQIILSSESQTQDLARRIAPMLKQGDVLLLYGDLGAGKSTFARALIQTFLRDKTQTIPSPTFTLMQTYDGENIAICHADLYRLMDAGEVEELGLYDEFTRALCLIEWPDILGDSVPSHALHCRFGIVSEHQRVLSFQSQHPRWQDFFNTQIGDVLPKEMANT